MPLSLLIIVFLHSCSTWQKYAESLMNQQDQRNQYTMIKKKPQISNNDIYEKSKWTIISDQELLTKNLYSFCDKKIELNGDEELKWKKCSVITFFMQFITSLHIVHPYGQSQLFLFEKNNLVVFPSQNLDANTNQSAKWSYALFLLLKRWNLTEWFEQEMNKWLIEMPIKITITKVFADNLQSKSGSLSADKKVFKHFWRGNELIKEGEFFPLKEGISVFLSWWNKIKKNYQYNETAIQVIKTGCSFAESDFLEGKTKPLSRERLTLMGGVTGPIFSLLWTSYASELKSMVELTELSEWGNFFPQNDLVVQKKFIPGKSKGNLINQNQDVIPYCYRGPVDSKKSSGLSFLMLSLQGRDPAQLLTHWLQYGIDKLQYPNDLEKLMNFSRHLILNSPLRVAFEVDRSTPEQLEKILRIGVPVYYVKSIGEMISFYQYKGAGGIILDPRGEHQECCLIKKN